MRATSLDPRHPAHCQKTAGTETYASDRDQFDARCYRPLHVSVQLDVCDIQAHLVKVKSGYVTASNFCHHYHYYRRHHQLNLAY